MEDDKGNNRITEETSRGDDMRTFARELAAALNETRQATPPEPTEAEKKAAAEAEKKLRKEKARRRRRRAFGSLILRIIVLAVVVYVLFFQIIGVTAMPSGDMYPRIDAGDLVLFYRLDKDVRAQDVIVFRKDASLIQDAVEAQTTPEPTATPRPTARSLGDLAEKSVEAVETPAPTEAPTEAPITAAPTRQPDTAPAAAVDNSFMGRVNRLVYEVETKLGIRGPEGKQLFVCRVIATAGDTVEITDTGRVVVNGNTMIESNIFSHTEPYEGFTQYPLTLQAGECFVLADLRNGGADSRFFGPVSEDEILGTVITIARRNNL